MKFRDLHRNIKIRMIENFVSSLGFNLFFPFMSIYLTSKFGVKLTGMLMILTVIAGVLSGFYGGYFADRVGRKKLMILAEGLRFFSLIMMTLANSPWFEWPVVTYLMIMMTSIFWGIAGPASEAMLLDVTDADSRRYVYSSFYWINNLSIAVGGIVGAFLFVHYRFYLFMGVSVVSLLTLTIITLFIQETYQIPTLQEKPSKRPSILGDVARNYWMVLKDSTFVWYVLACMISVAIEFQMTSYMGVRMAQEIQHQILIPGIPFLGTIDGVQMLGILRTENTVLVVLFAALVRRWFQNQADIKVLFYGLLFYTLGFCVIGFSNTPWLLVLAMIVATLGELMNVPVKQSLMGELAPDHARSSYIAFSGLTYSGANILASLGLALGAFLPSWEMSILYLCMGISSIAMFQRVYRGMRSTRSISTDSPSISA